MTIKNLIVAFSFFIYLLSFQSLKAQYLNPVQPVNPVNGIEYYYFEEYQNNEPARLDTFRTIVKSGPIPNFSLSPRLINDRFTFNYRGYIKVPLDTVYTFYTSSDDGTNLYIDTIKVVSNDGVHAEQERSGTIRLKAGFHKIRVFYFENTGIEVLKVSFAYSNVSKSEVPDSVLFRNGIEFPTFSNLIDTAMFEQDSLTLAFKVKSLVGNSNLIQLKSISSNSLSIPYSELIVGGSDSSRNVKIKTLPGVTGSVRVFINAKLPNNGPTAALVFRVNVKSRNPNVSQVADTFLFINTPVVNLPIQVSDPDNASSSLTLSATSSNQSLVSNSALIFSGNGSNRFLSFTPAQNGSGVTTISYEVKDPSNRRQQKTFSVTYGDTTTFRNSDTLITPVNGLDYLLARAGGGNVLNFATILPDKADKISNYSLAPASPNQEFYGMEFKGFVKIRKAGVYNFFTNSDDGSVLFIGNTKVVDNDGSHGTQERTGSIGLRAGFHRITVQYKQGNGGQTLEVRYGGSGITKRLLADSVLFRNDFQYPKIIASTDTVFAFKNLESIVPIQIEDSDGEVSLATAKTFSYDELIIPQTAVSVASLGAFSSFKFTPILPGIVRVKVVATDVQGLSAIQFFNVKVKDTITSVRSKLQDLKNSVIYPNPVHSKFEISKLSLSEPIGIFDIQGTELYQGSIQNVNIEHLTKGLYFIKLKEYSTVLKFIKE